MTNKTPSFIQMRDELIKVCADAYSVWDTLQGDEFAEERGWLKGEAQEKYFANRALYDRSTRRYQVLRVEIKSKYPEEVKKFAMDQYDKLSKLIKNTPKDDPNYDDEWRDIRRNWSALAKGKRTPYNEFWAWGRAILN